MIFCRSLMQGKVNADDHKYSQRAGERTGPADEKEPGKRRSGRISDRRTADGGGLTADPAWQGKIRKIYLSEVMRRKMRRKRKLLTGLAGRRSWRTRYLTMCPGRRRPQGILAVVERRDYRMPDILGAEPAKAHVLVLDNLQDPGQPRDHFPYRGGGRGDRDHPEQ